MRYGMDFRRFFSSSDAKAGKVRVDVKDARPQPLAPAEHPTDIRESGRGLDIVSRVADEAGSEAIPDDGKTVYATWNV